MLHLVIRAAYAYTQHIYLSLSLYKYIYISFIKIIQTANSRPSPGLKLCDSSKTSFLLCGLAQLIVLPWPKSASISLSLSAICSSVATLFLRSLFVLCPRATIRVPELCMGPANRLLTCLRVHLAPVGRAAKELSLTLQLGLRHILTYACYYIFMCSALHSLHFSNITRVKLFSFRTESRLYQSFVFH